MKNTKFVIIIVVCVCVILGGYYYLTNRNNAKEEENITLTEIQELTTKNLDKNFPATPREVVKLYNRIITCFIMMNIRMMNFMILEIRRENFLMMNCWKIIQEMNILRI